MESSRLEPAQRAGRERNRAAEESSGGVGEKLKIDENRNEVRQLMAELETLLQRTIGQQVEPLQNEIKPQVG